MEGDVVENPPYKNIKRATTTTRTIDIAVPVLNIEALEQLLDPEGYIQGVVEITLAELVEEDWSGLKKLLAERLIGAEHQEKLLDLSEKIVGHTEDSIFIKVRGNPKLLLSTISSTVSPKQNPD
ncbi:MAG: hypothetical protein ACXABY_17110 [Candidatus Thorarchaeota archaeon]|jgi:hypothetical protein